MPFLILKAPRKSEEGSVSAFEYAYEKSELNTYVLNPDHFHRGKYIAFFITPKLFRTFFPDFLLFP